MNWAVICHIYINSEYQETKVRMETMPLRSFNECLSFPKYNICGLPVPSSWPVPCTRLYSEVSLWGGSPEPRRTHLALYYNAESVIEGEGTSGDTCFPHYDVYHSRNGLAVRDCKELRLAVI
jgi:hypothetical protein